jgi:DNA-binding IclR family transcriptional regulator
VFAVQHAVEVLRCISRAPPDIGINEIARRVRLDKSSVSRLVRTLERERLVERATNSERVRIGFGLVSLAAPLLAGLRVTNLAPPVLEELARQTGETVNLSVWDGSEAVSVQQALGASAIKHYAVPGQRNPAHCTASGKLFLAYLDEAEIEVICRTPLESYSARTITDPSALRTEARLCPERWRVRGGCRRSCRRRARWPGSCRWRHHRDCPAVPVRSSATKTACRNDTRDRVGAFGTAWIYSTGRQLSVFKKNCVTSPRYSGA